MPTISSKVNKKEIDAITEYADACGETVSNLIRKLLIRQATFMDGTENVAEYRCFISIPDNITGEEETKLIQGTYNKIRRILGINEIKEL